MKIEPSAHLFLIIRHTANRSKEIQRVMRVHRDPFEPIMCVLEADSRLAEYRKITDEIVRRMRMRTDIHDQPPKSLDHSYCFGWACTLGLGKRTFANFVSAPVDTIRRQNAGWRV